jgi:eukaryotic-like serine/threonine-protein kinase
MARIGTGTAVIPRIGTGTAILESGPGSGSGTHSPDSYKATVVAGSALDVTLADPATTVDGPLAGSVSSRRTPPPQSGLFRTTVLPRIEVEGDSPQLVRSDRPRYERQGVLGEGGVGEVLRTMDNDIERMVAIKRLKTDMRGASHLVRFVDEIRTIGSMEHPNIVPIHDVGVDDEGQYFFVMKYVQGETLETIVEKLAQGDPLYHARFGFERRAEIFLAICEAISYAHARGVVHRDIKPANVMVGPHGEVTVMRLGSGAEDPRHQPRGDGLRR